MSWAGKRQAMYAAAVIGVIAVIAGGLWFVFSYHTPTCADGILNQNEEGIDCGGECAKLCQAPRVSALWARSVKVADGVYHAVAMVQNPEADAGTEALPYVFSLYDADNILIAERRGEMRLEPGEITPLLETNVVTGSRAPSRTFVTFGASEWKKTERSVNPVAIDSEKFDPASLNLTARIRNTSPTAVSGITLTALLYGEGDTLVGASQTVVPSLPPRGDTNVIFTWQEDFPVPVVRTVITSRL